MTPRLNAKAIQRLKNAAEAAFAIGDRQMATDLLLLIEWHERDAGDAELNAAGSQMLAALRLVADNIDRPPERNCSCHIAPPCSDCVDYGGLRKMFAAIDAAIAKAECRP